MRAGNSSIRVLCERVYIVQTESGELPTQHMPGAIPIPQDQYDGMREKVERTKHVERNLGSIEQTTSSYLFRGEHYILLKGDAQVGIAKTTDNHEGFGAIRLFANTIDDMYNIQREIGTTSM